ncbi:MAG: sugar phosphate isomerase/epimerase [Acidimicrobiia bacterium]|nr:sugar phosphate isomerase/epimerase [Acidimicrobiia bacterium]
MTNGQQCISRPARPASEPGLTRRAALSGSGAALALLAGGGSGRGSVSGAAANASLAATTVSGSPDGLSSAPYRFKIGMYLTELRLPLDDALAKAKQIGVDQVWFHNLLNEKPIAEMSDAEIDRLGQRVGGQGLKIFLINAGNPFKTIHLTEFDLKSMANHEGFRKEFQALVRSMQIAVRLKVSTVGAFTFAWPGEYSAGKPTWPMRWLTRGGVIADVDMEKLVKAFSMVAEEAERYGVDVALSMMPWNYTNTTNNFRSVVERVGSRRLKVMWGPADNLNCGEWDVATAGFHNVRPALHSLHVKDLHLIDGLRLEFEYRPLGAGDVDYLTILRNMKAYRSDAVLALATHFTPPSGSRVEAMQINYANLKRLVDKVEAES